MQRSTKNARRIGTASRVAWYRKRGGRLCVLTCFAVLAMAAGAGLFRGHAQSPPGPAAAAPEKAASIQASASGQQDKQQAVSAAGDARKQEIAGECADLLKLAAALKTEVDKTTKDTLSVTVVRKAGEIEQLAHKVRTGTGKS